MKTRHCVRVTRALAASIIACVAVLCTPALTAAAEPRDFVATGDLLARGAGYGLPHGDPQVRALQRRLRTHGMRPGPIDGLFGPLTEAAVERFQRESGLQVDGIVGPRTRHGLNGEGARTLQRRLRPPAEPLGQDNRARPADNRAATRGSEPSRNLVPTSDGNRTHRTGEPNSSSSVLVAVLALALAAGGGLLAAWVRGRRRRSKTSGVGGPAGLPAMRNGGAQALPDQIAAIHAVCDDGGVGLTRTVRGRDHGPGPESPSNRSAAQDARRANRTNGSAGSASSDAEPARRRIREMRASGMTLQAIADSLNADNVPTLRGEATWRPSAVRAASAGRGRSRSAAARKGAAG
jgi:hypothetical protein